jgi:Flp pilus assembly protein TadG
MKPHSEGVVRRWYGADASGQAVVEFALVILILLFLTCGLIDFSRFINQQQVMINVAREAASLASRGTSMTDTLTTAINSAAPLNISTSGRVILTSVTNTNGTIQITAQQSQGGIAASSRVGTGVGSLASLPFTGVTLPQPTQTLVISEVFYTFTPITPIGRLMGLVMPTPLYDVAYF